MGMLTYASTIVAAQVDGPTTTTAARASALPGQAVFTLLPNYFDVIGKQIAIRASGKISSPITTPGTARYDVKFTDSSSTAATVFDGLAALLDPVIAHTNVGWTLDLLLTARSVGTAACLIGQGTWTCEALMPPSSAGLSPSSSNPRAVYTAVLPWNSAPTTSNGSNFDATKSQTVDLNFTQTVATGSQTLLQYALIAPN